ncbi:hypothetical protein [Azospirillum sp. sgz302134]
MPWYIDGVAYTKRSCGCCRKEFHPKLADVRRGWGKFCSNVCKNKARRRRSKPRRKVAA